MVYTNRNTRVYESDILIDGTKIEEFKKTKFLGAIVDDKASKKDHVAHVVGKISRRLGIFFKTRKFSDEKGLDNSILFICIPLVIVL